MVAIFACIFALVLLSPANSHAQYGGSLAGPCTGDHTVPNLTVKVNGIDEPVYIVACDVRPPEIVSAPKPQSGGPKGTVVLTLIVTSKAEITNLKVVSKGADAAQDARAIEAAREYKFKPATLHGQAVSVRIALQIDFPQ